VDAHAPFDKGRLHGLETRPLKRLRGFARWGSVPFDRDRGRGSSPSVGSPASCPRWLSNTTCGAPSSRWARGTARMRVPSSSLTLRSGAPVQTRRGSGFEPLISRAVRGGAWAAPSLRSRPSRGLGVPALEALVSSTAWHGCSWYLPCFQAGLGATFSRLCPFKRLILSRARGSHRSRVLCGMGARDARFVSGGPRGDLLTLVPARGLNLSRARNPCRSRVLLVLQGTGPLNAPQ
jgi:hypothetical protein